MKMYATHKQAIGDFVILATAPKVERRTIDPEW